MCVQGGPRGKGTGGSGEVGRGNLERGERARGKWGSGTWSGAQDLGAGGDREGHRGVQEETEMGTGERRGARRGGPIEGGSGQGRRARGGPSAAPPKGPLEVCSGVGDGRSEVAGPGDTRQKVGAKSRGRPGRTQLLRTRKHTPGPTVFQRGSKVGGSRMPVPDPARGE